MDVENFDKSSMVVGSSQYGHTNKYMFDYLLQNGYIQRIPQMNISQLKSKIKAQLKKDKYPVLLIHPWDLLKFRPASYFEFKLPCASFCLEEINNKWEVYYTERGSKFNIKEFDSETEACEYFYNWILQSNKKIMSV